METRTPFYMLKILALFFLIFHPITAYADVLTTPKDLAGTKGEQYLKATNGKLYKINLCMTTDGAGAVVPCSGSGPSSTYTLVNQGEANDGSSPWHVIDDAWIADFDAWKVWADVNLSTRASESTLAALSAKFNSLGQKTMANSAPIVIASDQSSIPTYTVTAPGLTIKQQAITVGTSAVRLTTDGGAPSSTRVVLVGVPDTNSTANFYVGSSSVTTTGATRGTPVIAGERFVSNHDAGDYYIISDTAAQTVFVLEQE